MKRIALILMLLALMIPSTNLARQGSSVAGAVEEILGMHVGPAGVRFQVFSGGCTDNGSFRMRTFGDQPLQLLLVRSVTDSCEALVPYGTTVHYSWDSLGLENGDSFIVLNPRRPITVFELPSPR